MGEEHLEGGSVSYWRFEFDAYARTRTFLERLAQVSERVGYYPDIDFAATYVRIGIQTSDRSRMREAGIPFVEEMEQLAEQV